MKFKVSEEFAKFETIASTALDDARKAEVGARGCDLPVGTTGEAIIVDAQTLTLNREDEQTKIKSSYPAVQLVFSIQGPAEFKGRQQSRLFGFEEHPKMSAAQKYQQFLDFCENAGLPREIRQKTTADIFGWLAAEPRKFAYIVKAGKGDYRNIEAIGKTALPTSTVSQHVVFNKGDEVIAFGHRFKVESVTANEAHLVSTSTGNPMTASLDQIQKA